MEEVKDLLAVQSLTTKKNVLEYIEAARKFAKEEALDTAQVKAIYNFIDEQIEAMHTTVKVNTLVYLKNELRTKLGKFAEIKKGEDNAFLKFYKQTFANQVKTKEYTYAMVDLSRLSDQSVLETLKTINTFCLKARLTAEEKQDIMPMIKRIVDTQSLRFINQLRSMEGIRKNFKIRIVENNKHFEIKNI